MRRNKQIEFPPNQTHRKDFERFMILACIVMVVVVVIIVLSVDGSFIGPWG
jgi:hypothetical protein